MLGTRYASRSRTIKYFRWPESSTECWERRGSVRLATGATTASTSNGQETFRHRCTRGDNAGECKIGSPINFQKRVIKYVIKPFFCKIRDPLQRIFVKNRSKDPIISKKNIKDTVPSFSIRVHLFVQEYRSCVFTCSINSCNDARTTSTSNCVVVVLSMITFLTFVVFKLSWNRKLKDFCQLETSRRVILIQKKNFLKQKYEKNVSQYSIRNRKSLIVQIKGKTKCSR